MLFSPKSPTIKTNRLVLRFPKMGDYVAWANLRQNSAAFLDPWEPTRKVDYLSRSAFRGRVQWGQRSYTEGRAVPMLLTMRETDEVIGGITLDNISRGPSMSATVGYWIGEPFVRNGFMKEALEAIVHFGFTELDLSRIQAGCLPENTASRGLLEKSGFKYEGVAQSYLQIAGRWRNHVLYANLRSDRRGRTDVG